MSNSKIIYRNTRVWNRIGLVDEKNMVTNVQLLVEILDPFQPIFQQQTIYGLKKPLLTFWVPAPGQLAFYSETTLPTFPSKQDWPRLHLESIPMMTELRLLFDLKNLARVKLLAFRIYDLVVNIHMLFRFLQTLDEVLLHLRRLAASSEPPVNKYVVTMETFNTNSDLKKLFY